MNRLPPWDLHPGPDSALQISTCTVPPSSSPHDPVTMPDLFAGCSSRLPARISRKVAEGLHPIPAAVAGEVVGRSDLHGVADTRAGIHRQRKRSRPARVPTAESARDENSCLIRRSVAVGGTGGRQGHLATVGRPPGQIAGGGEEASAGLGAIADAVGGALVDGAGVDGVVEVLSTVLVSTAN